MALLLAALLARRGEHWLLFAAASGCGVLFRRGIGKTGSVAWAQHN